MERTKTEVENKADADREREAMADDSSVQDYRTENEAAEGQTTFGNDKVTPRLNDGR